MEIHFQEINSDQETMWGTPVFVGTRVPFVGLFQYLASGDTIDQFVADYPTVSREQAVRTLEEIAKVVEELVIESSHIENQTTASSD